MIRRTCWLPYYPKVISSIRGQSKRYYALSRFSERNTGVGRQPSRLHPKKRTTQKPDSDAHPFGNIPVSNGLQQLLFHGKTLVIERQVEMLNVFVGFEQSNKYTISDDEGEPLGYIAESSSGFLGTLSRQVFATHRPFRAVIMDNQGNPVLLLRRPFAWINSKMFVQQSDDLTIPKLDSKFAYDSFGEVQQIWHPWRRRYDLFLKESGSIVPQADSRIQEHTYHQVGKVDAGFLAWHFRLVDEGGNQIASIDRAFRGIGRELFTDTGRYTIHFGPTDPVNDVPVGNASERMPVRKLNLDERALFLALAVNIDFDYFSRHSRLGGGGIFHFSSWE